MNFKDDQGLLNRFFTGKIRWVFLLGRKTEEGKTTYLAFYCYQSKQQPFSLEKNRGRGSGLLRFFIMGEVGCTYTFYNSINYNLFKTHPTMTAFLPDRKLQSTRQRTKPKITRRKCDPARERSPSTFLDFLILRRP